LKIRDDATIFPLEVEWTIVPLVRTEVITFESGSVAASRDDPFIVTPADDCEDFFNEGEAALPSSEPNEPPDFVDDNI
jgi:hypothetical protein